MAQTKLFSSFVAPHNTLMFVAVIPPLKCSPYLHEVIPEPMSPCIAYTTATRTLLGVTLSSNSSGTNAFIIWSLRQIVELLFSRIAVEVWDNHWPPHQVLCHLHAPPDWHPCLSKTLSDNLQRVQRSCLNVTYPGIGHREALGIHGLITLLERTEMLYTNFALSLAKHDHFKHWLPPTSWEISAWGIMLPIPSPNARLNVVGLLSDYWTNVNLHMWCLTAGKMELPYL